MRILFSYPTDLPNEISLINDEMNSGNWDVFHLRKPAWTDEKITNVLNELDFDVKSRTVIHQPSKQSCHSFDDVEKIDGEMEYCFLSPVFDSISKEGYLSNFKKNELKQFLRKERTIKVIGLGGVTEDNYSELLELGFDGGAFLGSVWKKYE